MLRFAGWVFLFALVFWLGYGQFVAGAMLLLVLCAPPEWLGPGILVAPLAFAFAVGYVSSLASGRGPAMALAVGAVAGGSFLIAPTILPASLIAWDTSPVAWFCAAVLALASGLGGLLHHRLVARKRRWGAAAA